MSNETRAIGFGDFGDNKKVIGDIYMKGEGNVQFGPPEPTNRKYVLNCLVVIKRKGYTDYKGRKLEDDLAYLVPQEGDQRDRFIMAWLPESDEDSIECVGMIASPVDSSCRFKVKRANSGIDKPHLFVMSKGCEDILKLMEGKKISVTVLPESEEAQGDEAIDTDQDIQTLD